MSASSRQIFRMRSNTRRFMKDLVLLLANSLPRNTEGHCHGDLAPPSVNAVKKKKTIQLFNVSAACYETSDYGVTVAHRQGRFSFM